MLSFKLIGGGLVVVVACLLATALAASTRQVASREPVAALYVKDDSKGELRFLGNADNAQINRWITQNQDLLEQLRPTSPSTGASSGLGSLGSGVTPIIINTDNLAANTGAVSNPAIAAAPIIDLLPQIAAQAVVGNRRRVVNNRRRRRPVNNARPQIFIVRPSN